MARFRQNHTKNKKGASSMIKIIIFVAVLGAVLFYIMQSINSIDFSEMTNDGYVLTSEEVQDSAYHIPAGSSGQIVHHTYYSLSYVDKYEQAEWVAYQLTKESLKIPNVPRAKRFEMDPLIDKKSAHYNDYKGSGYSRGHLAPAGDMAFSKSSMEESFFMSNMSPQIIPFNGGVWNELENHVRDWAFKNNRVFVVTGPILKDGVKKYIGKRAKVGVPDYYYKVILDLDEPKKKAIGFILPNAKSEERMETYAVTVDEVERRTGLNFYEYLLDDETQESLESDFNINDWPMDESLYKQRINHWNKR